MGVSKAKGHGKQVKKAAVKLRRMKKRGKMKRHAVNAFNDVIAARQASSRKRDRNIEDDWVEEREQKLAEESDEDELPLDMMDPDVDYDDSAFVSKVRSNHKEQKEEEEEDEDGLEAKKRRFAGFDDDPNVRELLPIKVGGMLIPRRRLISEEEAIDSQNETTKGAEAKQEEMDLSSLSAAELLKKRKELLLEAKGRISNAALSLLSGPEQQMFKLKELMRFSVGENVHSLIRESVQKLAIASLAQLFIDLIPGYTIRLHTEDELAQKLKRDTKKLYEYEEFLLRQYTKYLQLLEKNAIKLSNSDKKEFDETTFSHKLSMLSLKCLCRLVLSAPHFNYSTNIISLLVRISTSHFEPAVDECCRTLGDVFRGDVALQVTAHGARSIAALVNQKKSAVSPKLLATFLKMNIKEVHKGGKNHEKERLVGKKFKLAKERKSKSKQKYAKQMKQLEADLKEAEASESLSSKLKYATDAMKNVFATYFRVIKRMPSTVLLEPVLEGLSKFAHLLNVEFFDDIVHALESLVEQKHLRVVESLHCVHAVFVILTGDGVALQIDPYRFYRAIYRLLLSIPFEKQPEVRDRAMEQALRSLELMLVVRRKQVSVERVAAFAKRLVAVACVLPTHCALATLAAVRQLFIAHPRLSSLVESEEDIACGGIFDPGSDDPDSCNAYRSSMLSELSFLSKHRNGTLALLARHISQGLPSTGTAKISTEIAQRKPYEWLKMSDERLKNGVGDDSRVTFDMFAGFSSLLKKEKRQVTSSNLHSFVCQWTEELRGK